MVPAQVALYPSNSFLHPLLVDNLGKIMHRYGHGTNEEIATGEEIRRSKKTNKTVNRKKKIGQNNQTYTVHVHVQVMHTDCSNEATFELTVLVHQKY